MLFGVIMQKKFRIPWYNTLIWLTYHLSTFMWFRTSPNEIHWGLVWSWYRCRSQHLTVWTVSCRKNDVLLLFSTTAALCSGRPHFGSSWIFLGPVRIRSVHPQVHFRSGLSSLKMNSFILGRFSAILEPWKPLPLNLRLDLQTTKSQIQKKQLKVSQVGFILDGNG